MLLRFLQFNVKFEAINKKFNNKNSFKDEI